MKTDNKIINVGNENEIALYLKNKLEENGFHVSKQLVQKEGLFEDRKGNEIKVPERFNLIAEKGDGKHSLLFLAHMDTVDVKQGWKTDPFKPTIKEVNSKKRIYGLGANDMKAGIAAIIAATENMNPKNYKIKIAFVVDEEFWSFGAIKLIDSDFLDDVKAVLVPEIGESNTTTSNQKIILGRMGRTEYLFSLKGRSAHGAQSRDSKEAVNAVHESIKLQKEIIKYCDDCEKEFSSGNISIKNSAYISYQQGGKPILSIPEKAAFVLDRSFVMNENMELEIKRIRSIVNDAFISGKLNPKLRVSVEEKERPTPAAKPYFFLPSNRFVKFVTKKVNELGVGHEYGIGYSVADENRIAELGIPVIVLGPEGGNCHSPNEWVDVESIKRLSKIYRRIAQDFSEYLRGEKNGHA